MGKLENVMVFGIFFLIAVLVVVMIMPDREGKNGFQALAPLASQVSQTLGQAFDRIGSVLEQWFNQFVGIAGKNASPPAGRQDQSNPIDNAIEPVQDYGEAQKELFNNTLP